MFNRKRLIGATMLALVAVSLILVSIGRAGPNTVTPVRVEQDVLYGKGAGQDLFLDLARPTRVGQKLPCIVFVHGGGWAMGDKKVFGEAIKRAAEAGYVAATVNYRLAPASPFPAQVEDVKCAVRFLRAHASKYGIDPDRIGAIGDSAGGHLVMMLAVTGPEDGLEGDGGWQKMSSAVKAVVSWYGPADLAVADAPEMSKNIVRNFLGESFEKSDLIRKASPISYVHSGQPPILMLQGMMDPLVTYTQAINMTKRLTEVHAPGRAELIAGAGHGFIGPDLKHAVDASASFFDEHLRGTAPTPR